MNSPLNIPPGVVKSATDFDQASRGRWVETSLFRWHDGDVMQPTGGWSGLSGAGSVAVGGPVRGMAAYRRLNGQVRVIFGTPTKLYDYHDGTLTNITPGGFTTGAAQASGSFYNRTEAATWQIALFGEDPIACCTSDGVLYQFDASLGGTVAAVSNAPVDNVGVMVTPERFLVALGNGGDRRSLAWADQAALTDWTPTTTNQAGDIYLQTDGQIMAGLPSVGESLIWTDVDLWRMRYIGGELIYSFAIAGSNCGAISRRSMVVKDGMAIWMGRRGFYIYDGNVRPLECPVGDYVFNRLNLAQASQVEATLLSEFNEVWFFYPSSTSDNDSAVVLNYVTGVWRTESIARSAGIDRGALEYPLWADPSGAIYEHENGTSYADEGGSPSYTPYAISGGIQVGAADQVMDILRFIPDEDSLGEARIKILSRVYPTEADTDHGYVTLAAPTDLRITARHIRLRVEQVTAGMRWGTPSFDVRPGSMR